MVEPIVCGPFAMSSVERATPPQNTHPGPSRELNIGAGHQGAVTIVDVIAIEKYAAATDRLAPDAPRGIGCGRREVIGGTLRGGLAWGRSEVQRLLRHTVIAKLAELAVNEVREPADQIPDRLRAEADSRIANDNNLAGIGSGRGRLHVEVAARMDIRRREVAGIIDHQATVVVREVDGVHAAAESDAADEAAPSQQIEFVVAATERESRRFSHATSALDQARVGKNGSHAARCDVYASIAADRPGVGERTDRPTDKDAVPIVFMGAAVAAENAAAIGERAHSAVDVDAWTAVAGGPARSRIAAGNCAGIGEGANRALNVESRVTGAALAAG